MLRFLPEAVSDAVLKAGMIGLAQEADPRQFGVRTSLLEQSELLAMECDVCSHSSTLELARKGGMRGRVVTRCSSCSALDAATIRCVFTANVEKQVDERLGASGVATVDRATYSKWIDYGGDAYRLQRRCQLRWETVQSLRRDELSTQEMRRRIRILVQARRCGKCLGR